MIGGRKNTEKTKDTQSYASKKKKRVKFTAIAIEIETHIANSTTIARNVRDFAYTSGPDLTRSPKHTPPSLFSLSICLSLPL